MRPLVAHDPSVVRRVVLGTCDRSHTPLSGAWTWVSPRRGSIGMMDGGCQDGTVVMVAISLSLLSLCCVRSVLSKPTQRAAVSLCLSHRSLPLSTATIRGASWLNAALSSSVGLRPNFSSARSESCRPMKPQARMPMPTPMRVRGERFR